MKHIYTLISFVLFIIEVFAQSSCEDRYSEPFFDDVKVNTITYSDITGFKMDVYTATDDDYNGLKPVVILAHGGSFYLGSKETPSMVKMCTAFAKRGYVAASIQYTLTSSIVNLIDSLHMIDVVMKAIGDGKAAVRWFRQDADIANQFQIDPNQIFGGGNSAGGVLMMNLAFVDEADNLPAHMDSIIMINGGFEGAAGNDGYSSEINGVLNLAGAIYNPSFMDNNNIPIISFHGDKDGVVPYNCNQVFWNAEGLNGLNRDAFDLVALCGSEEIHKQANNLNFINELHVFPGDGHTPWEYEETKRAMVIDKSVDFLFNLVQCNITDIASYTKEPEIKLHPNPIVTKSKLQLSQFGTNSVLHIYIFDNLGRVVLSEVTKSSEFVIKRGKIPNGIYVLSVKNEKFSKNLKILFK